MESNTQHGDIIVLQWTFTPPDYFEESINIEGPDFTMIIDSGKADAKISAEVFEMKSTMQDALHEILNGLFLGAQLEVYKPYELSQVSMCRLHPDGRRDITIFVEPAVSRTSGTAEIIIADKDGNVIVDSKRDRIRKKKELAALAIKHRQNATAASLLNSYKMAVNEPHNELVHLYEIRDALSKRFGNDSAARRNLNITSKQWDRLGILANREPLKQGRHRGENPGALRNATEAELKEVRGIAKLFVEAYLLYLDC